MNSKVISAISSDYAEIDLEEFEVPKYLEHLDSETAPVPKAKLSSFVEDIWLPQPELVEKSLEQLESEDLLYRTQLLQHTDEEQQKSQQIQLQRQIYRQVLELGIKIQQLPTFKSLPDYTKKLRSLIKSLLNIQTLYCELKVPKMKNLNSFVEQTWDWISNLAREWSSRVDLKIGADIIEQVCREAEKKTDSDIQLFLMRELKTENSVQVRNSKKTQKHKFSKHRKLKFDVHEKLMNFMTPESANWDPKQENLMNSLFGKKVVSGNKVYLDIPLV